mgnify:CR=1 FL=1
MTTGDNDRPIPGGQTVMVEFEDGIAWVTLNRPEKRNAMNPAMNQEMLEVVDALEFDDRCDVLVLTGAGDSFAAGMDLREYFRETDGSPEKFARFRRVAEEWQWRKLRDYAKPTIAMVNGWCFGGAFTPLCACDLAIAADEAVFGVSEINWGIIPAGNVTKALATLMGHRDALYYIMTGDTFTGKEARAMGVVNKSVPLAQLKEETRALAKKLQEKGPHVLHTAKVAFKHIDTMDWDTAAEWLKGKSAELRTGDKEGIRNRALTAFLDKKEFRPGLGTFDRDSD